MSARPPVGDPVAWHRAENLNYDADHELWMDFTAGGKSPVLDLGCGVGRVALPLADAGRQVVGLDSDPDFVAEFNRQAGDGPTRAFVGDALELDDPSGPLGRETFDRVIAPQNLVQIVGEGAERLRLFEAIRNRLAPGGRVAITFIEDLPEHSMQIPPQPEVFEFDGWTYSSLSVSLEAEPGAITLHRLRQRIAPDGEVRTSEAETRFTRVSAVGIEAGLLAAGLGPATFSDMPVSPDYIDSVLAICSLPASGAE